MSRNLQVLVAEDDAALLQLVAKLLEHDGYTVLTALDGVEALAAARNAAPVDIVFTDVVMPGMDGFELGDALAAEQAGIRGVFTTALMDDGARTSAGQLGCELLPKPYTPADLRRAVAEARPIQLRGEVAR